MYFRGATVAEDTRKPGFYAFRFPFTAYTKRGVAQVWGLAPDPGRVLIQRRRGGRWRTIARLRTRPGRMFFKPMRLPARRAAAGAAGRRDEPHVAGGAGRDRARALGRYKPRTPRTKALYAGFFLPVLFSSPVW